MKELRSKQILWRRGSCRNQADRPIRSSILIIGSGVYLSPELTFYFIHPTDNYIASYSGAGLLVAAVEEFLQAISDLSHKDDMNPTKLPLAYSKSTIF